MGQGLCPGDLLVATADPHPAGEVVEPQGGQVDPGHPPVDHAVPSEERNEEGEGRDQVRGVLQEPLPFGEVLVDQPVLVLLEVAESAVDQLGRLGGGARREVVLLHQGGAESSARGIQCHAGTGDASADDQHVEGLGSQPAEGLAAWNRPTSVLVGAGGLGHGPSLPQVARTADRATWLSPAR